MNNHPSVTALALFEYPCLPELEVANIYNVHCEKRFKEIKAYLTKSADVNKRKEHTS